MKSFITQEELELVQELDRSAPYVIAGVSCGQLSLARHYGGVVFQGCSYVYVESTDECIRDDVYKRVLKARKAEMRKLKKAGVYVEQLGLF